MVKIRYADLPDGWYAQARRSGRETVIYLAPGLTAQQRDEALHRLVRASQRGHGPRLQRPAVRLAVARDDLRSMARGAVAVLRCHPVASLLTAGLATAMVVCYAVFVTVSIQLMPQPSPGTGPGGAPAIGEGGVPLPVGRSPGRAGPGGGPGRPAAAPASASAPGSSAAGRPAGGSAAGGSAAGAPSPLAASPTPLPSSPGPTATGAGPTPTARPPAPAPSPTADSGAPGNPGVCVTVGPLGVCVSV
jgi:hypothetical protein